MTQRRILMIASLSLMALFLFPSMDVYAQQATVPGQFGVTGLYDAFKQHSQQWMTQIVVFASALFWTLALIEFALCFGMLAIKGTELQEVFTELMRRILILSFGAWILTNPLLFANIMQGFIDLPHVITGKSQGAIAQPEQFTSEILAIIDHIFTKASDVGFFTNPINSFALLLAGIIVMWGLSVASIQLILVLCELYVIMAMGLISMGFFSLELTREYPMRFFGALIGTGMKLVVLQLLLYLGLDLISGWLAVDDLDKLPITAYMIMAATAIAFKEIAVRLPDYIQSIFSGSGGSGLSGSGAATAALAVGAGVGAAAVGKVLKGSGVAAGGRAVLDAVKKMTSPGSGNDHSTVGGRIGAALRQGGIDSAINAPANKASGKE